MRTSLPSASTTDHAADPGEALVARAAALEDIAEDAGVRPGGGRVQPPGRTGRAQVLGELTLRDPRLDDGIPQFLVDGDDPVQGAQVEDDLARGDRAGVAPTPILAAADRVQRHSVSGRHPHYWHHLLDALRSQNGDGDGCVGQGGAPVTPQDVAARSTPSAPNSACHSRPVASSASECAGACPITIHSVSGHSLPHRKGAHYTRLARSDSPALRTAKSLGGPPRRPGRGEELIRGGEEADGAEQDRPTATATAAKPRRQPGY